VVYLQAPNHFVKEWVSKNYMPLFQHNLARLLNEQSVSVLFVDSHHQSEPSFSATKESPATKINQQKKVYEPAKVIRAQESVPSDNSSSQRALVSKYKQRGTLNEQYRFETFVVGPSNTLAFSAARAAAEHPGKLYNPLFIYGCSGLGKTHLLHAIGHAIKDYYKKAVILYQSADRFVHEYVTAIRLNKIYHFEAKYKDVDVLLVDDMQFISNKEQTQETFFHIFNTLHQANKQIVFTSDSMPRDIVGLAQRLRSRLEGGLIADIQSPTLETMMAIVQKKGESFGHVVPDDLAHFIASRGCCNVRELEGMLIRVIACASLNKEPLSLELAMRVLVHAGRKQDQNKTMSLSSIATTVAKRFGYTVQDLRSIQRNKDIAQARHIALYYMKKLTNHSLREIGKFLDRRDHSTVLHAYEKIKVRCEVDAVFAQEIESIEKKIME
jgi:chromosomal replication initiator protein